MKTSAQDERVCTACSAPMVEARGKLRLPVNGEEITVPKASHLRCRKCGEVVLRLDEARGLREGAFEIYRKKHRLLSADEIRAIRERVRLTQKAFAKILRLGGNTISRWESGRNVQTAAMDALLRLVRDIPGSIDYLRRHAAQTTGTFASRTRSTVAEMRGSHPCASAPLQDRPHG